jgi:hypothetical protein
MAHILDRLEEASAEGLGLELDPEEVEYVRELSGVVGRLEDLVAVKKRKLEVARKERFLVTGFDERSSELRVELHLRVSHLLSEIRMLEEIL